MQANMPSYGPSDRKLKIKKLGKGAPSYKGWSGSAPTVILQDLHPAVLPNCDTAEGRAKVDPDNFCHFFLF